MRRIARKLPVEAIAVYILGAVLMMVLAGCQTGTTGVLRPLSPSAEHWITNTISRVDSAAAVQAPQPWSTTIQTVGGTLLGLLAMWQAFTHRRVTSLESEVNGTTQAPPST